MNNTASRRLGFALVVIAFAAQAMAAVKSKDVVVEFSSDLPEFAQGHTEAMYLYDTGHNEVVLYLEQDHGRKLSILDVTDPAKITMVDQVAIDAPSAFDFVQSLRSSPDWSERVRVQQSRLDSDPWIRRYPQLRFSFAMRTTRFSISSDFLGRPHPRLLADPWLRIHSPACD